MQVHFVSIHNHNDWQVHTQFYGLVSTDIYGIVFVDSSYTLLHSNTYSGDVELLRNDPKFVLINKVNSLLLPEDSTNGPYMS